MCTVHILHMTDGVQNMYIQFTLFVEGMFFVLFGDVFSVESWIHVLSKVKGTNSGQQSQTY